MPKALRTKPPGMRYCPICNGGFHPSAFTPHYKKCMRNKKVEDGLAEYRRDKRERLYARLSIPGGSERENTSDDRVIPGPSEPQNLPEIEVSYPDAPSPADVADDATIDEIRTEYHPRSQKRDKVCSFEEYNFGSIKRQGPTVVDSDPWWPNFNSREDFLFAELVTNAHLNRETSEKLIKLINRCIDGKGTFTYWSHADVEKAWKRASSIATGFEVSVVSVPYKNEERKYDVLHRSLWDWAADLMSHPQLAPHFRWDAERIYRFNGESSTRIFHEPWTADAFWNTQSQLPKGSNPLCFILYADKTKLSSFGTTKGYPVVVRCANLPATIRNGNGFGGGRVVGWLPIIPEDPKEEKKPGYVNFKRAVWHHAFHAVVKSIAEFSKTGCWFRCGDGVVRWLFPSILILSADYEEQCTMALIRGTMSKRPCPICLVNVEELGDITGTWTLRTASDTQQLIEKGREISKSKGEKLLSEYGIRDVDNVFWCLQHSDPHRALSFDRLHSNNSGLFGYHLWEKFKALIGRYGRARVAQIDAQFKAVPRWSGLNHFREVMSVSFTDGTKFEDISKLIVFVAYNVVPKDDKEGWALLRCLRSFTIVDLYLSFETHTERTLATGQHQLKNFAQRMRQYIRISDEASVQRGEDRKSWNFPKMHALVHSFDDIKAKGASRNYNTKPNKKLHGPLKKIYLMQTNFRNIAPQILDVNHRCWVLSLIRVLLDEVDANASDNAADSDGICEDSSSRSQDVAQGPELHGKLLIDGHITLRSQQPPTSFASMDNSFRTQLSVWLAKALADLDLSLPCGVNFCPDDLITEYRSLRIVYESKVDFSQYDSLVYCSPKFHGQERRDFVIVQTTNGFIFARLLFVFSCSIADRVFTICSVLSLDAPIPTPPAKDRELGLRRVRARAKPEFIFARCIVRGAPLIQDCDKSSDYFVMDVVDHTGDIFLRCDEIFTQ